MTDPYVGGHPEMPLHPYQPNGDGQCWNCIRAARELIEDLPKHPHTCGTCAWEGPSKVAYYRHCLVAQHDHWENILALDWRRERRERLGALADRRRLHAMLAAEARDPSAPWNVGGSDH